jgi:hypothetical protein
MEWRALVGALASGLELEIPRSVLMRADRVIE